MIPLRAITVVTLFQRALKSFPHHSALGAFNINSNMQQQHATYNNNTQHETTMTRNIQKLATCNNNTQHKTTTTLNIKLLYATYNNDMQHTTTTTTCNIQQQQRHATYNKYTQNTTTTTCNIQHTTWQ